LPLAPRVFGQALRSPCRAGRLLPATGAPALGVLPQPFLVHNPADRGTRTAGGLHEHGPGAEHGRSLSLRDRLSPLGLRCPRPRDPGRCACGAATRDLLRERARPLQAAATWGGRGAGGSGREGLAGVAADAPPPRPPIGELLPRLSARWREFARTSQFAGSPAYGHLYPKGARTTRREGAAS